MFDWVSSTLEDCAKHIAEVSASNTYSQIQYYKRSGNEEVLVKILEARKLAKKYRVLNKARQIEQELTSGE